MRYRPLGDSGLMVSVVGLGCNAFGARIDQQATDAVVGAALDEGITLFDTSDTYGLGASETMLGKALGSRRDDVVVASKFGMDMRGENGPDWGARASRRYARRAVEASLRRLGTDHIDLYQIHTPDRVTPIEETLDVMSDLVTEGKVRYIGCSNFTAWELIDAEWTARTSGLQRFVSAQNEYSLYNRTAELELVPAAEHVGASVLPYFPLAYGLLTGKYARGSAPEGSRLASDSQRHRLDGADFGRVDALETYAKQRDLGILDVAIGGLAAQPAVTSVISGATKPEQVVGNVRAGAWQPTADDLATLDEINDPAAGRFSYTSFAP